MDSRNSVWCGFQGIKASVRRIAAVPVYGLTKFGAARVLACPLVTLWWHDETPGHTGPRPFTVHPDSLVSAESASRFATLSSIPSEEAMAHPGKPELPSY